MFISQVQESPFFTLFFHFICLISATTWSLTVDNVDFTGATIAVWSGGGVVAFRVPFADGLNG